MALPLKIKTRDLDPEVINQLLSRLSSGTLVAYNDTAIKSRLSALETKANEHTKFFNKTTDKVTKAMCDTEVVNLLNKTSTSGSVTQITKSNFATALKDEYEKALSDIRNLLVFKNNETNYNQNITNTQNNTSKISILSTSVSDMAGQLSNLKNETLEIGASTYKISDIVKVGYFCNNTDDVNTYINKKFNPVVDLSNNKEYEISNFVTKDEHLTITWDVSHINTSSAGNYFAYGVVKSPGVLQNLNNKRVSYPVLVTANTSKPSSMIVSAIKTITITSTRNLTSAELLQQLPNTVNVTVTATNDSTMKVSTNVTWDMTTYHETWTNDQYVYGNITLLSGITNPFNIRARILVKKDIYPTYEVNNIIGFQEYSIINESIGCGYGATVDISRLPSKVKTTSIVSLGSPLHKVKSEQPISYTSKYCNSLLYNPDNKKLFYCNGYSAVQIGQLYSNATKTASGLMSNTDKAKLDLYPSTPISYSSWYGVCNSPSGNKEKVVTITGYTERIGNVIYILFKNASTRESYLKINNNANRFIIYRNNKLYSNEIGAGDTATFVFDGTNYVLLTTDGGCGEVLVPGGKIVMDSSYNISGHSLTSNLA